MMGSRLRIPFLVDVVRVTRSDQIRALAQDEAVDRVFAPAGPLINRMIFRRMRRVLAVKGARLPSSTPREDADRKAAQTALADHLAAQNIPDLLSKPSVGRLADAVRGTTHQPVGLLTQAFVGVLFLDTYTATEKTWNAALTLDAGLRSNNPLRRLWWIIGGGLRRAQRTLFEAVGGDLAGVHATGVAVHTLANAVAKLAGLYRDKHLRRTLSPAAAVARALDAPDKIVRQATGGDIKNVGTLPKGTMVVFETRKAGRRSLDPAVMFLSESWSFCPAHALVPALLQHLWVVATGTVETRDPSSHFGEKHDD